MGYDFPMNLPDVASVSDGQQKKIIAGGGAITDGVSSSGGNSNDGGKQTVSGFDAFGFFYQ